MAVYQIVIIASLAFICGWREARRANALGMAGFYAIFGVTLMPFSDYRYSPDVVNLGVFTGLIVVGVLLGYIYTLAYQRKPARK